MKNLNKNKSIISDSKVKIKTDDTSVCGDDKRMEWFVASEVAGHGNFPTSARWTRDHLKYLAVGSEELRRKRKGTKAYEYHVSLLPKEAQESLLGEGSLIGDPTNDEHQPKQYVKEDSPTGESLHDKWDKLYQLLSEEHIGDIIELIQRKGVDGVLIPEQARQIGLLVSELPGEARKEILLLINEAQYCTLTGIPFKPARLKEGDKKRAAG